jgi:hypothetical protein
VVADRRLGVAQPEVGFGLAVGSSSIISGLQMAGMLPLPKNGRLLGLLLRRLRRGGLGGAESDDGQHEQRCGHQCPAAPGGRVLHEGPLRHDPVQK